MFSFPYGLGRINYGVNLATLPKSIKFITAGVLISGILGVAELGTELAGQFVVIYSYGQFELSRVMVLRTPKISEIIIKGKF